MKGPDAFIQHLNTHQYHPRSNAHSNAICLGILEDLLHHCLPIAEKAAEGELVAQLNHTITVNYQNWNIDLALGPPPGAPIPPADDSRISFAVPTVIEIAIEAKGVMTEHGKARHNRLRDLQAFHSHAHLYNQKVVAVGVVVVNVAKTYWSPTRPASDVTVHQNIDRIGSKTVELYRNLPLRNSVTDRPGFEAACVLVVEHDNLKANSNLPSGAPEPADTALITKPPAPQVGGPAELFDDGLSNLRGVWGAVGVRGRGEIHVSVASVSSKNRGSARSSRERSMPLVPMLRFTARFITGNRASRTLLIPNRGHAAAAIST